MLSNARFLVVAFVASAAISLAWQYHAAHNGLAVSGNSAPVVASSEDGLEPATTDSRDRHSEAAAGRSQLKASSRGHAKSEGRAGDELRTAIPRHKETYVFEYDEEWVGDFYTRLHSPDPPAANEQHEVAVVSGRVLTPNGRPVGGIEVMAEFRNYSAAATGYTRETSPLPRKTRTNDDGFYAFFDLPAGIYMLGVEESAQFAAARLEVNTGVKNADLVLDPQRLVVVKGTVTDPMGGELEKVRIMPLVPGLPKGVASNKNGEFNLGVGLENTARRFALRLQLDGYREQRYEVTEADWTDDGSIQLALTMEPAFEYATVSGSVTGPDGSRFVGEYVRLYSPSLRRNFKAHVNGAGEFLFDNVDIADDYQLWVRPTGPYRDFTEQNIALTPGRVRRDIELAPLRRDYRLSGRILDQNGRPVPNMTLTLRSKVAAAQKLPVTSNAYGEFEVENVPEGELVFESRTTPFYTLTGVRLSGNDKDREVDLVVPRGPHKLVGKVVDRNGRPIATRKIFISSAQVIDGISTRLSSSTSADAKGRFVFTDLAAGEHIVTVNAPGYEGIRLRPVVGDEDEIIVRLEKQSI
jgi:uncharacterized GH25 family protein